MFSIKQARGACGEGWVWFSAGRNEAGWVQVGKLLPGAGTVCWPEYVPGLPRLVQQSQAPVPSCHSDLGAMFLSKSPVLSQPVTERRHLENVRSFDKYLHGSTLCHSLCARLGG